jgi:hypothetical protein
MLRALKANRGIAFLLTNCTGTLAAELESIIHISFPYYSLNENSRSQIWMINLERIAKQGNVEVPSDERDKILHLISDPNRPAGLAGPGRSSRPGRPGRPVYGLVVCHLS